MPKTANSHRPPSILVIAVVLFCAVPFEVSGQAASDTSAAPHDTSGYPEAVSSRSTLEWALWLPGGIIHMPVRALFWSTSNTIGWIIDTKVPERIADLLESDDGRRKVIPTYSSLEGAGAELDLRVDHASRSSWVAVGASGWSYGRHVYRAQWRGIPLPGNDVLANVGAADRLYPTEPFFGLGPDSPHDQYQYSLARQDAAITLRTIINTRSEAFFEVSYEASSIDDGKDLDLDDDPEVDDDAEIVGSVPQIYPELPGVREKTDLIQFRAGLSSDSRDRLGNPSRGILTNIGFSYFEDVGESNFGFYRVQTDVTAYQHLFYGRVLAIRFAGEINREFSGELIPFYELASLGHKSTIRGFERNRLTGRDMMLASVEYRVPLRNIWDESGLDFTFFADAGQVSNQAFFRDVRFRDIVVGFGGGIRVWSLDGVPLRVEVARGPEIWRFYLILNK
jgi:hypothetical protein